MTNTIDLTPIIKCVISFIITVFTIVIYPKFRAWVDTKLTVNQIEVVKIVIKSFVDAAEQIYTNTNKSGASKKKYVMEMAKAKLAELGYSVDDKEIEAYLEQAVREMNKDKDADTKVSM